MKLTDMKVDLIKIPLKKPFRIALAVQDHSVNVLVKLITDEGIWGIGEAAPFEPVTGENANTVMEALKLFKQGLLGRDPMDLEGIHQIQKLFLVHHTLILTKQGTTRVAHQSDKAVEQRINGCFLHATISLHLIWL